MENITICLGHVGVCLRYDNGSVCNICSIDDENRKCFAYKPVRVFKMSVKNRIGHNEALKRMIQNPELIGIENVIAKYTEFPFFDRNGRLLGSVDIVYQISKDMNSGIYIVEYKCSDSDRSRMKARAQLIQAYIGLYKNYKFRVNRMFYVHDEFSVEELVNGYFEHVK